MHSTFHSKISFRRDINGLRAWAVLAVLLYHFDFFGLHGGFVGVDIFFVISGYLMTAIIVNENERGNFSIWNFYMARARRILPALFVVLIFLLALGWFWLPTYDYKSLGLQSIFAVNSLSNILFYKSAGYFDSIAEDKWLLHTWSLGIEAQFYILFPIFLTLVNKKWQGSKALTISIFFLFLISFFLNLIISKRDPSAAFYLLPTRIWELAAGGLVFMVIKQYNQLKMRSNKLYWLGWLLIIISFLFIDESFTWPSYWAIAPTLGTCLIILSQKEKCIFTNNSVAQWLGERSYSLYLWHWPFVVALYFANLQHDWAWVYGSVLLCILIAHYSYKLVEIPSRKILSSRSIKSELFIIAFLCLLLSSFAASIKFNNYHWRLADPEIQKVVSVQKQAKPQPKSNSAMDGDIVLLGDSHAAVSSAYLKQVVERHKLTFSTYNQPGCPMIEGVSYTDFGMESKNKNACSSFVQQILKKKQFKTVVIINRLPYYFHGPNEQGKEPYWGLPVVFFEGGPQTNTFSDDYLEKLKARYIDTVCKIKRKSNNVFLTRPIPEVIVHTSNVLMRNRLFKKADDDIKISIYDYYKRNVFIWEMQDEASKRCGVKIVDPTKYLCDQQFCYASKNGYPYYSDNNHLNFLGNQLISPIFEKIALSESSSKGK